MNTQIRIGEKVQTLEEAEYREMGRNILTTPSIGQKGEFMKLHIRAHTCEWMRRVSLILTVAMFIFFWVSFADLSGAKSGLKFKDISGAGWALWIFVIVGAIIILLQLIPAVIMLFSFIGTGTHLGYKVIPEAKEKVSDKCAGKVDVSKKAGF